MSTAATGARRLLRFLRPRPGHASLYLLLAIVVLGFVAYSPSLSKEFLDYDDDWYITANPYVQGFDRATLLDFFGRTYRGQYSPLPMLLEGIKFSVSGGDPLLFNLSSILIHLLNTCLVFCLTRLLFERRAVAVVVAALFAVHPLQVESIAWLSASMKTGLFAAFFLASLISYVIYVRRGTRTHFLFALGLFLLSCLSKEQAVLLSPTLIAIDWFLGRKVLATSVMLEKIPFLALSLYFGLVTLIAYLRSDWGGIVHDFPFHERIIHTAYAYVVYLFKLLVPYKLSAFYPYPGHTGVPISFLYWFYVVVVLAVLAGLLVAMRRARVVAFGLVFFTLNILFALATQFVAVRGPIMADRYVYMASLGFFFILGSGFAHLVVKYPRSKGFAGVAMIAYVGVLAVVTFDRTKVWKDDFALWNDAVEKYPVTQVLEGRGRALVHSGKTDEAFRDFDRAISLDPTNYAAFVNRGNIRFLRGQLDDAMLDFNRALEVRPQCATALAGRSLIFVERGLRQRAIRDLQAAVGAEPALYRIRLNLAFLYFETERYREAISEFEAFLRFQPRSAAVHDAIGVCHLRIGGYGKALERFDEAVRLDPTNGNFYLNRSRAYKHLNKRDRAIQDARKARDLGATVDPEEVGGLR